MIERRIVIGLIVSTDYIRRIRPQWDERLLTSEMARRLATWCVEYFDTYDKAPNRDIEGIYFEKLRANPPLPTIIAEEIEQDILPSLNDQYERERFNVDYLLDQTHTYFRTRKLTLFSEDITDLVQRDDVHAAETLAGNYAPVSDDLGNVTTLGDAASMEKIEHAFTETTQHVIEYPRALGDFWNDQMVRGGFVALMGSDKRGKTFWLLDLSTRGYRQGSNVAFIQAGDMTESQQLVRLSVHLSRKSNMRKYSGVMHQPVRDCVYNQMNSCSRSERECVFGVFDGESEKEVRDHTRDDIVQALRDDPEYTPCTMCDEQYKGAVWLKEVDVGAPLTADEAKRRATKFFDNNHGFKLASYANGTLTVREIKSLLHLWERQDGFVPDIIAVDYADLLITDEHIDHRHKIDTIWKALRNLSQERHCLVLTATHTDAAGYGRRKLSIGNFSEDRRKNAHVTAMYGLNQDPHDREKDIGLMRINEIVIREGAFSSANEVTVLQNLRRGLPFLSSYW